MSDPVRMLWVGAVLLNVLVALTITMAILHDIPIGKAFGWHPILMSWAFLVFMTTGVLQVRMA